MRKSKPFTTASIVCSLFLVGGCEMLEKQSQLIGLKLKETTIIAGSALGNAMGNEEIGKWAGDALGTFIGNAAIAGLNTSQQKRLFEKTQAVLDKKKVGRGSGEQFTTDDGQEIEVYTKKEYKHSDGRTCRVTYVSVKDIDGTATKESRSLCQNNDGSWEPVSA